MALTPAPTRSPTPTPSGLTPQEQQILYGEDLKAPGKEGTAIAAGLLVATVCYSSGMALTKSYGPSVFCSPFFVGAVVGLFAYRRPIRASLITILSALLLAVVTLREGVVCCLMALPFVLPVTIIGAICASVVRRHLRGRRARRLLGLALTLTCIGWQAFEGATDDPARHPVHVARSSITVAAPPEQVFGALAHDPLVVRDDWPWFLRLGLPMPRRFVVEEPIEGGRVTGAFSQGLVRGHVTTWKPGRTLAYAIDGYEIDDLPFHITRLGRGPSYGLRSERVEDWLTIESTRWDLSLRPDGGTELRRELVWRRHLAPAVYFGWLQQTIIQRGQDRLLALVRERIAATPRPSTVVASVSPPP